MKEKDINILKLGLFKKYDIHVRTNKLIKQKMQIPIGTHIMKKVTFKPLRK